MRDTLRTLLTGYAAYALLVAAVVVVAYARHRRAARTAAINATNAQHARDAQAARDECRRLLAEMRAAQARINALAAANQTPTAIPSRIARQLRNDPGLS